MTRRSARMLGCTAVLDVCSRLMSQPMIEQAKEVLMATYRLDADYAFQVLKRFSQAENIDLGAWHKRWSTASTEPD